MSMGLIRTTVTGKGSIKPCTAGSTKSHSFTSSPPALDVCIVFLSGHNNIDSLLHLFPEFIFCGQTV